MHRRFLVKLAISLPLLVLLVALDGVPALEGVPLLLVALGVALLALDYLRAWLKARERVGLAMVPFMAAALVLLFAFCRGRNLSQLVLLVVTMGVVFTILLAALAVIGEGGKRGAKGVLEFVGLASVGLLLGFAVSLIFLLEPGRLGGISLAGP